MDRRHHRSHHSHHSHHGSSGRHGSHHNDNRKKTLITPASHLRRKAKGLGYIEELILDIMNDLESEVLEAIERRQTSADVDVPTTFDIPTMTNKQAQKRIYGTLIEALLDAEYTPKFIFMNGRRAEKQMVKLVVTWMTKSDKEEDQYIHELIQKYSVVVNVDTSRSSKSKKYKSRSKTKSKNGEFRDMGNPKYSKDPSKKKKKKKKKEKYYDESEEFSDEDDSSY